MSKVKLSDNIHLVGITGRAGAGKDTFADMLEYAFYGMYGDSVTAMRFHLAEPIKDMLRAGLGMEHTELERLKRTGGNCPVTGINIRKALQTLGTEWGRAMDRNMWIKLLFNQIEIIGAGTEDDNRPFIAIIPDVRFYNEEVAIREQGGKIFKVIGRESSLVDTSHASEQEIKFLQPDYMVINDSTKKALFKEALDYAELLAHMWGFDNAS